MPSITISVSAEAHARLKKLKEGKESFSDLILRQLPEPCDTGVEILASLERDYGLPKPKGRKARRRRRVA